MAWGFGRNYIIFDKEANTQVNSNILDLLSHDFSFLPRDFTVTTNNGSYKFISCLLKQTSSRISDFINKNPNVFEYHLDVDDPQNVMKKIEDLYLGKKVNLNPLDTNLQEITNLLDLYFLHGVFKKTNFRLNRDSLRSLIQANFAENFTINLPNHKSFECNTYGVNSSKIIRDFRANNPQPRYFFNFVDENNDFELIEKFFNFDPIEITIQNANSLLNIAEGLQIDNIIDIINKFIETYESSIQKIDDKQSLLEPLEDIFDLLYNIDENTAESVKDNLLKTFWVHSEQNVQELVAIILQVASSGIKLQPYLLDLITLLNKSADDKNNLSIFLPFLLSKLINTFYKNANLCFFIYKMSKNGFYEFNDILDKFRNILNKRQNRYSISEQPLIPKKVSDFFSPDYNINQQQQHDTIKKERDTNEPTNEIMKSIFYDDIETFQSILIRKQIDVEYRLPPGDILTITNQPPSMIDYSAECGSLKCFKHLLVNHAHISSSTFALAVYGGNSEIIRTIDHQLEESEKEIKIQDNNPNQFRMFHFNQNRRNKDIDNENRLTAYQYAISKHSNDIFDWIISQKSLTSDILYNLAKHSVQNGNVHSLIACFDNGLNTDTLNRDQVDELVSVAAENGFYRIVQLLLYLFSNNEQFKKKHENKKIDFSSVIYGNTSILKLIYQCQSINLKIGSIIKLAFDIGNNEMIFYIIDDICDLTENETNLQTLLYYAMERKNSDIFTYIDKKYNLKLLINELEVNLFTLLELLCTGSESGNFVSVKRISEILHEIDPYIFFTNPFISAANNNHFEIINYFIDQKYQLNYFEIAEKMNYTKILNKELIHRFINSSEPQIKDFLATNVLNKFIKSQNIEMIIEMSDKCRPNSQTIKEILKLCLPNEQEKVNYHPIYDQFQDEFITPQSVPFYERFSNQISPAILNISNELVKINNHDINCYEKGCTLLLYACSKNQSEIVKILLKSPKIDVNLYNQKGDSPLILAINNNNSSLAKLLLQSPGIEVNHRNFNEETALTCAVQKELTEIIDLILKHPEFDPEESLLNYSFYLSNDDTAEQLISAKTLDVNHKCNIVGNDIKSLLFVQGQTPLLHAAQNTNKKKVKLILNHPSFDKQKSLLTSAITESIYLNDIDTFKVLLNQIEDLNIILSNGQTLFDTALSLHRASFASLIMNQKNFSISKNDILSSFKKAAHICANNDLFNYYSTRKNLSSFPNTNDIDIEDDIKKGAALSFANPEFNLINIELLQKILDYDKSHDHMIDLNKLVSFIPGYVTNFNEYASFLIKNINLNLQDSKGVYPLEYGIKNNSLQFVSVLLKSGKVDLKKTLKTKNNGTFLHLAATVDDSSILQALLDTNEIDVNAKDDLGETALMKACKYLKLKNIKILFRRKDIDYSCCNKKNEDALKIVKEKVESSQKSIKDAIEELPHGLYNYRKEDIVPGSGFIPSLTAAPSGNDNNSGEFGKIEMVNANEKDEVLFSGMDEDKKAYFEEIIKII